MAAGDYHRFIHPLSMGTSTPLTTTTEEPKAPKMDPLITYVEEHISVFITIATAITIALTLRKKVVTSLEQRLAFKTKLLSSIDSLKKSQDDFYKVNDENVKGFQTDIAYLKECADKAADTANKVAALDKKLSNGISHKLALLSAGHQQIIESDPFPLFVCDETGENTMISHGYCNLLDLQDTSLLTSVRWQDAIYGEVKDDYLSDFERAVSHKTGFISSCDFQNPLTKEPRGRWRVVATCSSVNEALIFTGRFIPEDDRAKQIAEEHNW